MVKALIALLFLWGMVSCTQSKKAGQKKNDSISVKIATDSLEHAFKTGDTTAVHHQSFLEPVATLPSELTPFVPQGYNVLDTVYGDLNNDQYADVIIVLKQNHEDTATDPELPVKRPLLILIGQADKAYKLAARNDNAVYCINCGGAMGDPFNQVVIKKGYFTIEHYGGSAWRWGKEVTFKYSPADADWLLHRDESYSFHASEPEKEKRTVKTPRDFGKVLFGQYNIYED